MIISYFSVFDEKAAQFAHVFAAQTAGAAERQLSDSVRSGDSIHAKHPEDFSLYHVFDFDDEEGVVQVVYDPPRLIVRASQLVV